MALLRGQAGEVYGQNMKVASGMPRTTNETAAKRLRSSSIIDKMSAQRSVTCFVSQERETQFDFPTRLGALPSLVIP